MQDDHSEYCAIFADIVSSRKIVERNDLQTRLLQCLDLVNIQFSSQIIAPFKFVAGDSVNGLLKDKSKSYAIIRLIQSNIHPQKMRFAVGIGELSTAQSTDISEVDGPALHRANEAMQLLKGKKRSHSRSIYFCSANSSKDDVLNALTFLVSSIRSGWTDTMREKSDLLESGLTLAEVGEQLGVSHQAVRKSIVQANYYSLAEGEVCINSILSNAAL